ncbi:cytochrome b/b6 domain-containing protein [Mesobacterium pallidum]|uniref:cytochrome b/b6 domain-containing protein n=1 Tax=Mesobacterium pallidum TaxID=2872037 RepID=UPI001EE23C6B|nr:cytochrome b/b6 domain-containing protein [Mesobacterium pallidum]
MRHIKVWDPLVRIFHWSLVAGFTANALIVEDESKLHEQMGYVVVALVLLRVFWGIVGTAHARFRDFPPSISGSMAQLSDMATGRRRVHVGHTPLGALMIYNLLVTMLAIGATGYMMTTNAFWGVDWVEELHEVLVGWAELSVVLHIAAVVYESVRTGVNLPRSMVTGAKSIPEDVRLS